MSSEAATKSREQKRAASTQELMSNIRSPGAGEISKKREKELQDAINRGRGVEFLPGKPPVVEGLTQKGGKKVFNTNAKATDYTGRIVSPAPTFGEMLGDMSRAVFGGQAKEPGYLKNISSAPGTTTENYMQYASKPKKVKGIVPTMIEKGAGPVGMAMNAILGKENLSNLTAREKYMKGVKAYAKFNAQQQKTLLGGQRNQKGGLIK